MDSYERGPGAEMAAWRAPENRESGTAPTVPEGEMEFEFVRSSGPGGQNVNKVSSKARLRWNVGKSGAFTEDQKSLIRAFAGKKLKSGDDIIIEADTERDQPQNREAAIRRLQELVAAALVPKKERKPTKVSRGQKQRRLDDKRREGEKKSQRREPRGGW